MFQFCGKLVWVFICIRNTFYSISSFLFLPGRYVYLPVSRPSPRRLWAKAGTSAVLFPARSPVPGAQEVFVVLTNK